MGKDLTTRIVGPWIGPERFKRRNARKREVAGWQDRVREFSIGGRAYLEIWPLGYGRGDKRVKRAAPPKPPALPKVQYIPSPNYSERSKTADIVGIVIHETEGSFSSAVSWFSTSRSKVSAHLTISEDGRRVVQSVPFSKVAWHVRGYNQRTIGIELAGYSSTANDPQQLRNAARIVAYLCHRYGVPARQGTKYATGGIVRHKDVHGHTTNSDPGGFPWSAFLAMVREEYAIGGFPTSWGRA